MEDRIKKLEAEKLVLRNALGQALGFFDRRSCPDVGTYTKDMLDFMEAALTETR